MECERRKELLRSKRAADDMVFRYGSISEMAVYLNVQRQT
jgi:hypothetical protein